MRFQLLMPLLIALAFSVLTPPVAAGSNTSDTAQVIEVTAKKYEFSPSPIRVKQGTKVQLKITATDHVHGFRIATTPEGGDANGKPGLVLSSGEGCNRIEQGQTVTVEFVAQTPGTYPFKCCVHCGWHHGSMHGELIVEP
jgi:cytochrome c oxidase subunit II